MSRLLEVANERVAGALFVFAMALANGGGPSWQAWATAGGAVLVAGGGWVVNDRLSQQLERDRLQDAAMKEALQALVEQHEKASQKQDAGVQRLADSIEVVANKAHDTAIKSLELGMVVKDLQTRVESMQKDNQAQKDRELEELRRAREEKKR